MLRLKEDPREWLKFTTVATLLSAIVSIWLWRRGNLPPLAFQIILALLAAALAISLARPRWFRPFYRAGMTFGFYCSQITGRVLLALLFIFLLTPLAILLRLQGRDLLELRRNRNTTSYWKPARQNQHIDRAY
jgi:hypothetical protein